jgi:sigma-E factor negative regulatory protein RseB
MRQALVFFQYVVVVAGLLAGPAYGQAEALREKREAQTWLKKIQVAAQKLNYAGVFVYQQADQVRASRITHIVDGKNEIEKVEVLDGRPREYIRQNDDITYYVPEAHTLLMEKRVTQEFPAILGVAAAELADHYVVRKQDAGRVAGIECEAILLEPKDKLRYGYRLWADKNSGLLLRAQTLDEEGFPVEQIAFTQIYIGHIDRNLVRPSFGNTSGWRVEKALMNPVTQTSWSIKSVPAGFHKVRELSGPVSDVSGPEVIRREVVQIVFSDGLAAISVFIEPGTQSRTEGSMRQGAMNIIGKRLGEYWLTIVGEVPTATIRQVANSIEFKAK